MNSALAMMASAVAALLHSFPSRIELVVDVVQSSANQLDLSDGEFRQIYADSIAYLKDVGALMCFEMRLDSAKSSNAFGAILTPRALLALDSPCISFDPNTTTVGAKLAKLVRQSREAPLSEAEVLQLSEIFKQFLKALVG